MCHGYALYMQWAFEMALPNQHGKLRGGYCFVFLLLLCFFFSWRFKSHITIAAPKHVAGGNFPLTEDYCTGTVYFVPKVCFLFMCAVGARLLAGICTTAVSAMCKKKITRKKFTKTMLGKVIAEMASLSPG